MYYCKNKKIHGKYMLKHKNQTIINMYISLYKINFCLEGVLQMKVRGKTSIEEGE